MVERILRPVTGVYQPADTSYPGDTFTPVTPPTAIVGDGLQLSDEDLATGVEIWHTSTPEGWTGDYIGFDFAQIPTGAQIVGDVVHYTATFNDFPSSTAILDPAFDVNGSPLGASRLTLAEGAFTAGIPLHYVGAGDWAAALQVGPVSVHLYPRSTSTESGVPIHFATIHEAWIIVDMPGGRPPHCRIVQRGNDGLGITGGQRVVQRRTIQASNRAIAFR